MIGSYIPGEVIAAANGAIVGAIVALSVAVSRTRERLARVEEWQRLHEREHEQLGDEDEVHPEEFDPPPSWQHFPAG